jgi:redox-sensitive bicupin YhaK (pirin superfamily)
MSAIRTVRKVVAGTHTTDGAGVNLVRVIGHKDKQDFDPFLMLDAFDSINPNDYIKGFPWHPHRGIETITYLIKGNIEHQDSLGNKGAILDGQCQWMTTGSGIIHQEMPRPSDRLWGVQLWLNLPAKDKMTAPKYRSIRKEDIPVIREGKVTIHVIAGRYHGYIGATEGDHVKALYLDIEVEANGEWCFETENTDTLFIYIMQGEGCFDRRSKDYIEEKQAVLFNEGDALWIKTADREIRFLLFSGKPLKEPIAWGGPIVMNTQEELKAAFRELDENTFIK